MTTILVLNKVIGSEQGDPSSLHLPSFWVLPFCPSFLSSFLLERFTEHPSWAGSEDTCQCPVLSGNKSGHSMLQGHRVRSPNYGGMAEGVAGEGVHMASWERSHLEAGAEGGVGLGQEKKL